MTEYLDEEDVLSIAEITLGSRPKIREWGLLSSAVQRPRSSAFGQDAYPDLFEKAAALLHSVASNHSLIDGNKRTGWATAVVFLDLNGYELAEPLDEDKAEAFVLKVSQSRLEIGEIAENLASFVKPS
ncbi:type II toxin-antitoxin system death-on-curing family toxin [Streptomyces reniochalinae]|uniref:Type II toxin-antitoxin system death-on-curing family toxin n=1 Tax=Streptomyces reniochalinae TaxID=2250578 RepID=A0A367EJ05_9ACTN|nr:type II toxin-antitoxin system death-on-curing family toxin [Streptomyces reniochalinae]RCG18098.1 type II toxin-antitoxin system death-on-curing family toxin [Streptomyces reniochalinae]